MSTTHPTTQNGTGSTERITDLRELDRGDRVVFGVRTKALEVIDIGVRTVTDERIDASIETPLVRVRGTWDGAVERVLAHTLKRWADGIVLEELDEIVACESDDLSRGKPIVLVRVESADGEEGGA